MSKKKILARNVFQHRGKCPICGNRSIIKATDGSIAGVPVNINAYYCCGFPKCPYFTSNVSELSKKRLLKIHEKDTEYWSLMNKWWRKEIETCPQKYNYLEDYEMLTEEEIELLTLKQKAEISKVAATKVDNDVIHPSKCPKCNQLSVERPKPWNFCGMAAVKVNKYMLWCNRFPDCLYYSENMPELAKKRLTRIYEMNKEYWNQRIKYDLDSKNELITQTKKPAEYHYWEDEEIMTQAEREAKRIKIAEFEESEKLSNRLAELPMILKIYFVAFILLAIISFFAFLLGFYETTTNSNSNISSRAQTAGCCKICIVGKPCGNSCISRSYSCYEGKGCACGL